MEHAKKLHSAHNDKMPSSKECIVLYIFAHLKLDWMGVNDLVPKGIYRFIHKHFAQALVIIDAIVENARWLLLTQCVSSSSRNSLISNSFILLWTEDQTSTSDSNRTFENITS